ncbi:hypothetical protein BGI41_06005 [Methanobrevibacter sp. 87.7]|uniref:hypothetical protein n=1 Tax=Methanobrevibacter sp. 87.7 TaxID=387957 RepID=UPI000B511CEB|nr:hypothetical protein [Methanobrevibacter sp. 87.7]OWT32753.1 hypothetical protein BGI41_06005 [Methanobrevibacter sp. 87.7]
MLSKEDKDKINDEVVLKINTLLEEYDLPSKMDKLTVLNLANATTFMGNFRIHKAEVVNEVNEKAENILSKYGELSYKCQRVVPCCDLPYHAVSFNFKIQNDD